MSTSSFPQAAGTLARSYAILPDGKEVPYLDVGAGEPILFVHGSLCDYRYWESQVNVLALHYRCLAVSLSHYWPSDRSRILDGFSWEVHTEELSSFINALGLERCHVVGHSRGGAVAFHLALRHPKQVTTLSLADPGGPLSLRESASKPMPAAMNALRACVAEMIEAGDYEQGLELFVDSVSKPGFWAKSSAEFRHMALDNAHTLPLQFRDPLPAYSAGLAEGIRCPTLLIGGQKSPKMFRNNVESLAEWVRFAVLRTIPGASHGMNISSPRTFNAYIAEFIGANAHSS
ncbi:alpha/beta fold hydrolase [Caballeronia sordidicola]|uniref:alpha/beta fold hydrolase n=1 Tax=Caballeronia sordidicola TaxID=196367 RepID=UPI0006919AD5|nr:alpha/beta hydrolase [Caballeronia sordidicola]